MSISRPCINVAVRCIPYSDGKETTEEDKHSESCLPLQMLQISDEEAIISQDPCKPSHNAKILECPTHYAWWSSFNWKDHLHSEKDVERAQKMPLITQDDIWNTLGEKLLSALMAGENLCLLSFSFDNTWRNYTTFGPDEPHTEVAWYRHTKENKEWGLLPRLLWHLLNVVKGIRIAIRHFQSVKTVVYDLLDPSKPLTATNLKSFNPSRFTLVELGSYEDFSQQMARSHSQIQTAGNAFSPAFLCGPVVLEVELSWTSADGQANNSTLRVCTLGGDSNSGNMVAYRWMAKQTVHGREWKRMEPLHEVKTKLLRDQASSIIINNSDLRRLFVLMRSAKEKNKLNESFNAVGFKDNFLIKYFKRLLIQEKVYFFFTINPEESATSMNKITLKFARLTGMLHYRPLTQRDHDIAQLREHCRTSNLQAVQDILTKNPDLVNERLDIKHQTVLHICAFKKKSTGIIRWVLETSDLQVDINAIDMDGNAALHISASRGVLETCNLLLGHGADVYCGEKSFNAVWSAARKSKGAVVKAIYDFGIKNPESNAGTSVQMALQASCKAGKFFIFSMILEYIKNKNAISALVNWRNFTMQETTLHIACYWGRQDFVKRLIEDFGADPNICNKEGQSALHLACNCGQDKVVLYLMTQTVASINYDAEDKSGYSALESIFANGIVEALPLAFQLKRPNCDPITSSPLDLSKQFVEELSPYSDKISLENVNFISVERFLEAGKLVGYKAETEEEEQTDGSAVLDDFITQGSQFSLDDDVRILFVSHRWASVNHPDPENCQFEVIKAFLQQKDVGAFNYIWIDYSSICQQVGSEEFLDNLVNIPTAILAACHVLVITRLQTDISGGQQSFQYSDLADYSNRGWCQLEMLLCLFSGCKTTFAFQFGQETPYFHTTSGGSDILYCAGKQAALHFANQIRFQSPSKKRDGDSSSAFLERFLVLVDKWCRTKEASFLLRVGVKAVKESEKSDELLYKVLSMELSEDDLDGNLRQAYHEIGNLSSEKDRIVILRFLLCVISFCMGFRNRTRSKLSVQQSVHKKTISTLAFLTDETDKLLQVGTDHYKMDGKLIQFLELQKSLQQTLSSMTALVPDFKIKRTKEMTESQNIICDNSSSVSHQNQRHTTTHRDGAAGVDSSHICSQM